MHDLAIPPEACGAGVAAVLIQAYFAALRPMKARFACLTAINGSRVFWERHGFRVTAAAAGQLDSCGEDAQYMSMPVAP